MSSKGLDEDRIDWKSFVGVILIGEQSVNKRRSINVGLDGNLSVKWSLQT